MECNKSFIATPNLFQYIPILSGNALKVAYVMYSQSYFKEHRFSPVEMQYDDIITASGLSRRTVINCLNELKTLGLVTKAGQSKYEFKGAKLAPNKNTSAKVAPFKGAKVAPIIPEKEQKLHPKGAEVAPIRPGNDPSADGIPPPVYLIIKDNIEQNKGDLVVWFDSFLEKRREIMSYLENKYNKKQIPVSGANKSFMNALKWVKEQNDNKFSEGSDQDSFLENVFQLFSHCLLFCKNPHGAFVAAVKKWKADGDHGIDLYKIKSYIDDYKEESRLMEQDEKFRANSDKVFQNSDEYLKKCKDEDSNRDSLIAQFKSFNPGLYADIETECMDRADDDFGYFGTKSEQTGVEISEKVTELSGLKKMHFEKMIATRIRAENKIK